MRFSALKMLAVALPAVVMGAGCCRESKDAVSQASESAIKVPYAWATSDSTMVFEIVQSDGGKYDIRGDGLSTVEDLMMAASNSDGVLLHFTVGAPINPLIDRLIPWCKMENKNLFCLTTSGRQQSPLWYVQRDPDAARGRHRSAKDE